MGESAMLGFYYKGQFYRTWVCRNEETPTRIGQEHSGGLPAKLEERAAWIEKMKRKLDLVKPDKSRGEDVMGSRTFIGENNCLIPSSQAYLTWTYLIDLDNEVFTVNGTIHFSLHTIPLQTWPKYLGYPRPFGNPRSDYSRRSILRTDVPVECIGTVSRWPQPDFDPAKLAQDYASLSAIETSPAEWGVPSWDLLSVSQSLSIKLMQTVLLDHPDIFSNPDVAGARRFVNLCCWQLVSAAAPSLLHCPPMSVAQLEDSDMLGSMNSYQQRVSLKPHTLPANLLLWDSRDEHSYLTRARRNKANTWDHIYWTLRGCVVGFCPRLDTPDFVKLEVLAAVDALKRSPSGKSVAIMCSGQYVIAVSLRDGAVHHTPALLIHDKMLKIQSGALLMIHLLNAITGNKTFKGLSNPRAAEPALTSGIFPDDVLCEIIHYSGYETYQQLSAVCRYAHSVCLSHPRINDSILIRPVDGGFVVRDRITGREHTAHMRRIGWETHKHLESTFHVRQAGYAATDQIKGGMAAVYGERILMHFTPSRKPEGMNKAKNLRILGVWGRWVMEEGVTSDENAVALPKQSDSQWHQYYDEDEEYSDYNEDHEDSDGDEEIEEVGEIEDREDSEDNEDIWDSENENDDL